MDASDNNPYKEMSDAHLIGKIDEYANNQKSNSHNEIYALIRSLHVMSVLEQRHVDRIQDENIASTLRADRMTTVAITLAAASLITSVIQILVAAC